ncbi:MAG: transcriptional repressor [Oscillibacter sp.]|nr:transcriptional repressor [Oscillibacter sp.]
MSYSTKQQQAILSGLERHGDTPVSALELAEELRQDGCQVSLATVYRQLEKLAENGQIHRVEAENAALYRPCPAQEAQNCLLLRCSSCGRTEHLEYPQLQEFYQNLEEEHHFHVDPRRTVLTGLCALCTRQEDPEHGTD